MHNRHNRNVSTGMATGGGPPYSQQVVNELWLELRYMVQWINTGQVHCVDLYWALKIIRILDVSTGFARGHYTMCREKIIETAHQYNIVPQFMVFIYFLHLTDFNQLFRIFCMSNN